jgi:Domain of unknown function (DUF4288)
VAHIPLGAVWYIAQVVEEITVEGESSNVVHNNFTLIRADSPEDAYQRALTIGRDAEISYENPAGKKVDIKFRGLADIQVIHDQLEHGAELLYEQKIGLSEVDLQNLLRPKEKLAVFRPIEPSKGPDFSSGDIMKEVWSILRPKSD